MLFKVATKIEGNQAPFLKWMSFFCVVVYWIRSQSNHYIYLVHTMNFLPSSLFVWIDCLQFARYSSQWNINTSCVCITKHRLASLASVQCLPAYVLKVHSWISFNCWRRKIESIRSWTITIFRLRKLHTIVVKRSWKY